MQRFVACQMPAAQWDSTSVAVTCDTPLGMVESALEFARIARDAGYEEVWMAEVNGGDSYALAGAVAHGLPSIPFGLPHRDGRSGVVSEEAIEVLEDARSLNLRDEATLGRLAAAYGAVDGLDDPGPHNTG